uniref:Ig-like domain-containing protein n=1 Tax=Scleropages formosus TaxID=113540 RepID=A0A8C9R765_SCLFO
MSLFHTSLEGHAVVQSPDLFVERGLNVTLTCSQNKTDFNSMYWFRQRPGQALKLVVYSYVQMENMEEEFKSRFSAKRIDTSLSLTLHHLQVADSAVYFCAKQETQWCTLIWAWNKNTSHLPTQPPPSHNI